MKLRLLVLLAAFALPVCSFAQTSVLTVFSEDGDRFILYLNGVQQNNVPQANLRVDGLTQPYYKARIVFEDKAKGQVDKNVPVVDPSTNANADVVYRIKNKDGEMKLRYYSAQPVPPAYNPPPDQYVIHYGVPDQTVTTTQTTVTQTTGGNTGNGSGSVSFGFGAGNGGVNMNVNVNDPNMNGGTSQTTTTTTTTTTSSSSYSSSNSGYNSYNQPVNNGCQYPMDWNSFNAAKKTVEGSNFDETRLSTAKTILTSNCFNTDQVIAICKLFGFEATKLDFAKYAYSRTTDRNNYFKVGNVFEFDASKEELNNYISTGR